MVSQDPLLPQHNIRFVAFDVDGTLVGHPDGRVVWEILNRRFIGTSSVNALRFQAYLKGELSYEMWVRLDVEGWMAGGATREAIESAIREELHLVPHASMVVHELRRRGYGLGVVSGTINVVLDVLFPDHPFDYVFTNKLAFDGDGRIASWSATPYDMEGKAEAIRHLSQKLGLSSDCFGFVGDHINDCSAMSLVGCSVAYDPKHDDVRKVARYELPAGRLDLLLDLFA